MHVDNDDELIAEIKQTAKASGFQLVSKAEDNSAAYQVFNLYVGEQYIKIVRILQSSGGNWKKSWLQAYNQGKRGVFSLVLETNDIDGLYEKLTKNGFEIPAPRKTAPKDILEIFSDLLGLKKLPPWRILNLPPIPGTDMEISFIEYDEDSHTAIREIMQPNSNKYGITAVKRIKIYLPDWEEGIAYLGKVFPTFTGSRGQHRIELGAGEILLFRTEPEDGLRLKLETLCEDKEYLNKKFQIENLELKNIASARQL